MKVVEEDVTVTTSDGSCDAAFVHPASGSHPGVLIWANAFGLRPVVREMAKRLAAEGYSVLAPNPYYRVTKAPVFGDISKFDFKNPEDRAKLGPLMGSLQAPGAAAPFHGGGLVTSKPDSPHLLAPKIKAQMYFAVASNDDKQQPDAERAWSKLLELYKTAL
jgi:carboxymethylenebutenolidase